MGHLRGYGHSRVPYAWIWLGQYFDLIMLCYRDYVMRSWIGHVSMVMLSYLIMLCCHEYVMRSWTGYVIMIYDKLSDYIMLL